MVDYYPTKNKYAIPLRERQKTRRERLLYILQDGVPIPGRALAAHLGVDRLTIQADMRFLKEAGHPVVATKGRKNGGYRIAR